MANFRLTMHLDFTSQSDGVPILPAHDCTVSASCDVVRYMKFIRSKIHFIPQVCHTSHLKILISVKTNLVVKIEEIRTIVPSSHFICDWHCKMILVRVWMNGIHTFPSFEEPSMRTGKLGALDVSPPNDNNSVSKIRILQTFVSHNSLCFASQWISTLNVFSGLYFLPSVYRNMCQPLLFDARFYEHAEWRMLNWIALCWISLDCRFHVSKFLVFVALRQKNLQLEFVN